MEKVEVSKKCRSFQNMEKIGKRPPRTPRRTALLIHFKLVKYYICLLKDTIFVAVY